MPPQFRLCSPSAPPPAHATCRPAPPTGPPAVSSAACRRRPWAARVQRPPRTCDRCSFCELISMEHSCSKAAASPATSACRAAIVCGTGAVQMGSGTDAGPPQIAARAAAVRQAAAHLQASNSARWAGCRSQALVKHARVCRGLGAAATTCPVLRPRNGCRRAPLVPAGTLSHRPLSQPSIQGPREVPSARWRRALAGNRARPVPAQTTRQGTQNIRQPRRAPPITRQRQRRRLRRRRLLAPPSRTACPTSSRSTTGERQGWV